MGGNLPFMPMKDSSVHVELRLGISMLMMFIVASGLVHGQEALRSAVETDRGYRARTAARQAGAEQIKAGPVIVQAGISYAFEWNDNIYYRPENTEEDFIHRPQFNVHGIWPVTRESVLSFGVGVGYELYTKHSDLSRLAVTPDSELAWDIAIKDFGLTLFDRIEYSQDVLGQPGISRAARFPRLENTVGFRARWNPKRWVFEAGYSHFNFISWTDEYDYLNRSTEQFFGRVGYRFGHETIAGIEVSADLTDYDSELSTDNVGTSIGPFVQWQLTRDIELNARGGYVMYSSDKSLLTGESRELRSYYSGVEVRHRITRAISHSLSVDRQVRQSFWLGGDFMELLSVRYGGSWAFYKYAALNLSVFYENGKQPRAAGLSETFDRYGFNAGVSYQILRRLGAGLGYRYVKRDSDVNDLDYRQNAVIISGTYRF